MARNDGIDRTSVRNANLTRTQISNTQRHNEREKESYINPDIVPERTALNIHFKRPTGSYAEMFAQMKAEKVISTRGLKDDACLYGELIFDVNSAYFDNHGGYDFARQFYTDAYKSAIEIVGGEQFILSAVMHADERNRAMSEALERDVYHYHLHVVYIPVVEKQVLWSKRCKDKSLVGTVKETITQVSSSKKWKSLPAMDDQGKPILQKNGKPVLRKSYSVLQDDFFNAMRAAGYTDVKRGERGSSEEHLTVAQFKTEREQERLAVLKRQVEKKEKALQKVEQKIEVQKGTAATFAEIDNMGRRTLMGKVEFSQQEAEDLKQLAQKGVAADTTIRDLQRDLKSARRDAQIWKRRYEELKEQVNDFLVAVKKAPERVMSFISKVLQAEQVESPKVQRQRKNAVER
ncbi:recombinase [Neglecta sp. X4]|uniref:plasmid recombination protein n=1 Tax=unclassified Neglectibacter TaxID=2632164 RepID=UPI00136A2CFF|nr:MULTISPECIES: plasmid recombination protein [unclassified Neglectibacter]NBI16950.1 recombinase [Neglectibacter sp. 59]NBJ72362.1 recombinase [Neglectibacter sp. X4]NCE80137.1 recombinase [Neglectibacter sp. X58]